MPYVCTYSLESGYSMSQYRYDNASLTYFFMQEVGEDFTMIHGQRHGSYK